MKWRCVLALAVGAAGTAACLAQAPVNQVPIELPVYTVTDIPVLPEPEKWQYCRIEGFEVLCNASPGLTKDFVKQFQRFQQAIDLIWPGIRQPSVIPASLIVCARGNKFQDFLGAREPDDSDGIGSVVFRGREASGLIVNLQVRALDGPDLIAEAGAAADSLAGSARSDAYAQLYRQYIMYLMQAAKPRAPAWLEEGLAQLLTTTRITETSISLGQVEPAHRASGYANQSELVTQQHDNAPIVLNPMLRGPAESGAATRMFVGSDFNAVLANRPLLPMAEMFAVPHLETGQPKTRLNTWAKQCQAFVHWGLYGDVGKNQKAFVTFVRKLGAQPPTEALAKECFGKNFRQLEQALRGHIEWTRSKVAGVRAGKGEKIPDPALPEIREATEAEVGRIKGEALLGLGRAAEGRREMLAPYIRGQRDHALLAALGLFEARAGDADKARKFLRLAAQADATRPRVYFELARLQLEEIARKPGAGEKLSGADAKPVLELLYHAITLPPALPENYHLLARVWQSCAVTPSAGHLDALEQGLIFFPDDTDLLHGAAALRKRAGMIAQSAALIERGLAAATDEPTRRRFADLKASLPLLPPTPNPKAWASPDSSDSDSGVI